MSARPAPRWFDAALAALVLFGAVLVLLAIGVLHDIRWLLAVVGLVAVAFGAAAGLSAAFNALDRRRP